MILYFSLIAVFIFSAFVMKDNRTISIKLLLFILTILGIVIITCFRGINIGNDTEKYITLFNSISKGVVWDFIPRYEIGYVYLNKVIFQLLFDEQALLIVTGLITWICVGVFIYKNSKNPSYSLFLILTFGFASFFMSGIRETLAIAFSLIGFFFIQKKKKIPFIVAVLIATLFHITAVAFIFAYPIYHFELKRKQIIVILGATIVGMFLFDRIVSIFISFFPHYSYYLTGIYSTGGVRLASVLNFIFVFFIFITCRKTCEKYLVIDQNCLGITNLIFFGACLLLFSFSFNLLDRLANYYDIFLVVAIPNILLSYNRGYTQWFIKACFITILFITYFSCVQFFRPEWNRIYPYQFYTQESFGEL
jgi:hypothetical protein